jgi:prepilin peptidase CpaA
MYFVAINLFLVTLVTFGSLTDIRTSRIPNLLTIPCTLAGMVLHTLTAGMDGFLFSLMGCAAGIGLLILPYLMSGMGAGDVKFMGAVGSLLGAKATLEAFVFVALAGGVYSLVLILIRRDAFKGFFSEKLVILSNMVMLGQSVTMQSESSGKRPRLKYGVAIAFGTITYLVTKALGIKFIT